MHDRGAPGANTGTAPPAMQTGPFYQQCLPDQTTGKEDRKVLPGLILYTSCILMSAEA